MNARDELALILVNAQRARYTLPPRTNTKHCSESCWAEADAILAAGYRKPRTITTAEELDALDVGTVVRASNGEVFEKQEEGPYYDGPHDWQSFEGTFWNGETFEFPATVLHEPEATA